MSDKTHDADEATTEFLDQAGGVKYAQSLDIVRLVHLYGSATPTVKRFAYQQVADEARLLANLAQKAADEWAKL